MPYFITVDCMQCGACESGCEVEAIHEVEERFVIEQAICIECGTCEMNCPFDAIIYVTEEELRNLIDAE
jgi:ferredoxin